MVNVKLNKHISSQMSLLTLKKKRKIQLVCKRKQTLKDSQTIVGNHFLVTKIVKPVQEKLLTVLHVTTLTI